MGDKPGHIIPIPKTIELRPTQTAWPSRVRVHCDAPAARSLASRFETELCGHGEGELSIRLKQSGATEPESYELRFEPAAITVSAPSAAGFHNALQTLKQVASDGTVPTGAIADHPTLAVRGFHLNFESYRRMNIEAALRLVEAAARFKLNTLLIEYGPRFPFESYPEIRSPSALAIADMERLNAAALSSGIRIVPLQQSLAHLDYALSCDRLSRLRERQQKPNLMCPNDPESLQFFKTLAAEIIRRHPNAEWFHLGGDEARKIGHCPRCASLVREHGHGQLLGRYLGDAARWLLEQGLRPLVWDDTLCAHPDAIGQLPKETIICYWDYIAVADPTPVLIPRMAHAAGGPRVAHDWSWTLRRKRGRLSDVQRRVMGDYSKPARLKNALGAAYLNEFGPYLGPGFPRWIRALPYLEYYQDRGHDVICCPTGMGNGDTADPGAPGPNFERFEHNLRTHAARCKQKGSALGIVTTAWYNMPPEMLFQPLVRTAQCAW